MPCPYVGTAVRVRKRTRLNPHTFHPCRVSSPLSESGVIHIARLELIATAHQELAEGGWPQERNVPLTRQSLSMPSTAAATALSPDGRL